MLSHWSVRRKILVSVIAVQLSSLLAVGMLSGYLFINAAIERLERNELVATVNAVRNDIDKTISVAIAQARQLAVNTFLLDWMAAGEPAGGVAAWQRFAQAMRMEAKASQVAWISERTGNYYDDSKGLARRIDPGPGDNWFRGFLGSGMPFNLNLGSEASTGKNTLYVNALAKDAQGQRAVVSVGLDVTEMAERIRGIKVGEAGQVFVVSEQGQIQMHRDPGLVKVDNKVELSKLPGMAPVAAALLTKGAYNLARYTGPEGEMIVVSSHLPAAGWFVVVEIPQAEISAHVAAKLRWLLLLDVVVLFVAVFLTIVVARSITGPLGKLSEAMRALTTGNGDLTIRLAVESEDETGRIARSFNLFMEQLHGMFVRVRDQSELLNRSVAELGDLANQLAQVSSANTDLAEATAATIEEITVSVSHIADNTQSAAQVVSQAGALSQKSAASVGGVSQEIGAVAHSMDALSEVMRELETRSGQVGSIASVIKEIADQTNLLALNAAIEAARAGEQGRGFAVVADEVRKLAERTSLATIEIEQMVSAMRVASESAMGRVAHTHGAVQSSVEMADAALGHIQAIGASMQDIVQKTHEIRDSATEQSRATEDMAKAAERMSTQAQAEDAEIGRARDVVTQLEDLSRALRQVVANFKL